MAKESYGVECLVMTRVAISVEGPTEDEFCKQILTPYFRAFNIELTPIIVATNRIKCGIKHKGGCINLDRVQNELKKLLHNFDYVTTFYDLYGFDGIALETTADELEKQILDRVNTPKLIPYIQKYEFETLLLSQPSYYEDYFDNEEAKIAIEKMINSCGGEVENVNNSKETAPSKRVIKLFNDFDDSYDKVFHGSAILQDIGLDKVMQECHRFASWIEKIKALSKGKNDSTKTKTHEH
ncbi:MAG: DUF4276 family protein [Sulfurovum sp.]|nr:DUF4276 family protein [Sulfurovum sp.]